MKEIILAIISVLIVLLTFFKSQKDGYDRVVYSEAELESHQVNELQYDHKAYNDYFGKTIR